MIDFRKISVVLAGLMMLVSMELFADGRPKVRVLGDKRYEQIEGTLVPFEKKEKWGFAETDGKPAIPAVFSKVMPFKDEAAFVAYELYEGGPLRWTLISMRGEYLTELEFDKVVKDFDEHGLAVVRQGNRYGIISHTGKMIADCSYRSFSDKGPVYLLNSSGSRVAVVKEHTDKGYSTYSFAQKEPVIVKTKGGYGIISPNNLLIVADFKYDNVMELVPGVAWCLEKSGKKYLYAADMLSMGYDNVINGSGMQYFVVKNGDEYGILSRENKVLLSCSQQEFPVLRNGDYTRFVENGKIVYLDPDTRLTSADYDRYLYEKYKTSLVEYLLETTLDFASKTYVKEAVVKLYGTNEYARIQHLPEAVEYAESRRFILLSKDNENAKFFDLSNGRLLNADEVLYHAFPSKSGAPAYASCLRDGKFGIIDIRNKKTVLPFEYDKIKSLEKGYVSLQKGEAYYLYNVTDSLLVTPSACAAIDHFSIAGLEFICVEQNGKERIFNQTLHRWILPEEEELVGIVPVVADKGYLSGLGAFVKKGSKGAIYSIANGERLTDYLFETVSPELFAGKYHVVTAGGKKGLYDLAAKKYAITCLYDEIKGHCKYNGEDFAVVVKANKCGLHNITRNKLVISVQNDEIEVRGGYAAIRRGGKYATQSLKDNHMVFDSPVENIMLLEGGYAILFEGEGLSVYDMNRECSLEELGWYKDIVETAGDYVAYTNTDGSDYRLLNYKTLNLAYGDDGGTCQRLLMLSKEDPCLKKDYLLWIEYNSSFEYVTEIGLYDMGEEGFIATDLNTDVFGYMKRATSIDYAGDGLLKVNVVNDRNYVETWIYDVANLSWLLKSAPETKCDNYKGLLVFTELDNSGKKYLFDANNRSFIQIPQSCTIDEYIACSNLNISGGRYIACLSGDKWMLYDYDLSKHIPFTCDRISLMYEQK